MLGMKQVILGSVSGLRYVLPLSVRKRIVVWLGRQQFPGRYRFPFLMLPDLAKRDPGGFHQFLWSHHLGHAESYEVSRRYGDSKLESSRRILFEAISSSLRSQGIRPDQDVESVFDAGCSLGYVLRFAETNVFRSAAVLRGIDVDGYAVKAGSRHLEQLGSKVKLACSDMSQLGREMEGEIYDVVLCFGVLMYLDAEAAARAIKVMLQHTRMLLALSTWPHPTRDNSDLTESNVRASDLITGAVDTMDGVLIHNLDAMVSEAGGRVVSRRWTGTEVIEGDKPLYFVIAAPTTNPT